MSNTQRSSNELLVAALAEWDRLRQPQPTKVENFGEVLTLRAAALEQIVAAARLVVASSSTLEKKSGSVGDQASPVVPAPTARGSLPNSLAANSAHEPCNELRTDGHRISCQSFRFIPGADVYLACDCKAEEAPISNVATVHIHAQPFEHAPARILGNSLGLSVLRDGINGAIQNGSAIVHAFQNDGEGYATRIECLKADALAQLESAYSSAPPPSAIPPDVLLLLNEAQNVVIDQSIMSGNTPERREYLDGIAERIEQLLDRHTVTKEAGQ